MPHVMKTVLEMYQSLLGLVFSKMEGVKLWHDEIEMYQVRDAGDDGSVVGYFFLDLHPREGKYGHAACFGLQPGCVMEDGGWQVPCAAMVANFTKSTVADAPSLMNHDEVVTLFHEFGHVMHQLCSKAEFARFAGTAVERDFVEAPSQMLENWCWEKEPLQVLSKNVQSGQPLPEDMITKLVQSKNANIGLLESRQLSLGIFDQTIHSMSKCDVTNVIQEVQKRVWGIEMTPDTCMPAAFGHLAGGYDAQYYGYMWALVFSDDMFARFKK